MNYFKELVELLEMSFAPYSEFNVASIVVSEDGDIYKGVNVESAAYPTTNCAERNAIQTAVTEGVSLGVKEVHILARNKDMMLVEAYPCGSCRQVIAEQSLNKAKIFVYTSESEIKTYSISELLPFAFLGENL